MKTIRVNDTYDPTQWSPYDCVLQVSHSGNKIKWQDYATIKDEADQTSALQLVLSDGNASFRVKEDKCGELTFYTR